MADAVAEDVAVLDELGQRVRVPEAGLDGGLLLVLFVGEDLGYGRNLPHLRREQLLRSVVGALLGALREVAVLERQEGYRAVLLHPG